MTDLFRHSIIICTACKTALATPGLLTIGGDGSKNIDKFNFHTAIIWF